MTVWCFVEDKKFDTVPERTEAEAEFAESGCCDTVKAEGEPAGETLCVGKKKGERIRLTAQYVVKVAIMAAMLTSFKFALSFVPNVEVVTVLIAVYASAAGVVYALPAVLVFCAVEVALYGAASWVLLYFLYWPLLALLFSLLSRRRNLVAAVAIAVVMSLFFGVLSACCDTLFVAVGVSDGFNIGQYWLAYYVRGLYFDIVHTVSNFFVVGVLYLPLCSAADRIFGKNVAKSARINSK